MTLLQNTEISIIVPTYNESQNIRGILEHIQKSIPKNLMAETIVVDDNSPDHTAKIAEDYFYSIKEKTSHTISVIKRKAKEDLNDKSDAINLIVEIYGKEMLEPELRPEFIKELLESQNQKTVKVKNWNEHFDLN